ncbi:MAG: bestrophin family protein [Sandaracinaceae bacterium]|nr:bestrophin family protein [Sandaracinaceae bacterium]
MYVPPDKLSWLRMLFKYRGTALRRTKGRIAFTTGIACVITYFDLHYGFFHQDLTPLPFTLVGLALGIFLGFRNNTSYDRFWEGRKLWGSMVNTARTLTRQILTLVGPQPELARLTEGTHSPYRGALPTAEERATDPELDEQLEFHREMVHRVAAYVHSVRKHLRSEDDLEDLRRLISNQEADRLLNEPNRPYAILQKMGERFRDAWLRGWVHAQHLPVLEQSLTSLTDIQGGCERIKSTPIPFSYTALIHRIVAIYCVALPFGITNQIGALTPVVVAIISYAFFGLDAVGDEIEDPFGTDDNDLPLTAISTMIEINIRTRIGDKDLPEPIKPKEGVLV